MSEKKSIGTYIVDRAKIQAKLLEREEVLAKVEKNLIALKEEYEKQSEQKIGLLHRINELKELLN